MSSHTPDTPAKRYHHGDLPVASVQVAVELLKEGGVEKLSLREVARRLGVSATALYHHFPDKEALLSRCCQEGMGEFRQRLVAVLGKDPSANLGTMGLVYLKFFLEHPYYLDLLFLPKHKENPEVHAVWHQTMDVLNGNLMAQGWSSDKADVAGLWLWTTVHGLAALIREGTLGNPALCHTGAPEIFRWSSDEVAQRLLPLVTAVMAAYPEKD